jgi:hypothetical protein
MSALSHFL